EDLVPEQVGRRHGDDHPGLVQGFAEALEHRLPLLRRGPERHEVIVVEAHAVGAEVGQAAHDLVRRDGTAGLLPEWVAARVAHSPQPGGELVLRFRRQIGHAWLLVGRAATVAGRPCGQAGAGSDATTARAAPPRSAARSGSRTGTMVGSASTGAKASSTAPMSSESSPSRAEVMSTSRR